MAKTALVLVDIQNDYFPGGRMELVGPQAAAAQAARLIDRFRGQGRPVIHVRHESVRPGSTFFLPGTDGARLHDAVAPASGEAVVVKHYPNSFRETELQAVLTACGAQSLVICGMMTHMCIDATTRAAWDLGYACAVASDACATRDLTHAGTAVPAAHVQAAFLAALGAVYARVVTVQALLDENLG